MRMCTPAIAIVPPAVPPPPPPVPPPLLPPPPTPMAPPPPLPSVLPTPRHPSVLATHPVPQFALPSSPSLSAENQGRKTVSTQEDRQTTENVAESPNHQQVTAAAAAAAAAAKQPLPSSRDRNGRYYESSKDNHQERFERTRMTEIGRPSDRGSDKDRDRVKDNDNIRDQYRESNFDKTSPINCQHKDRDSDRRVIRDGDRGRRDSDRASSFYKGSTTYTISEERKPFSERDKDRERDRGQSSNSKNETTDRNRYMDSNGKGNTNERHNDRNVGQDRDRDRDRLRNKHRVDSGREKDDITLKNSEDKHHRQRDRSHSADRWQDDCKRRRDH